MKNFVFYEVIMKKNLLDLTKTIEKLMVICIILLTAVVPTIVHLKQIPLSEPLYSFWNGEIYNTDFFSYYKSLFIIIIGALSSITLLVAVLNKTIAFKKMYIYIPTIIYLLTIILSTILSKNKSVAIFGFPDRYEGMLVLVVYLLLFFLAVSITSNEKNIKHILTCLLVSASLIAFVGFFQYFGYNIFESAVGKWLILFPEHYSLATSAKLSFGSDTEFKNAIYSTLFNSNSAGSYMAMLFPLSFVLFIQANNAHKKVLLGGLSSLLFINLIGCHSRGAYIGAVISVLLMFFFMRRHLLLNLKPLIVVASCCILFFVSMNVVSHGDLGGRLVSVIKGSEPGSLSQKVDKINNFKINNETLTLFNSSTHFNILLKDGQLFIYDENQKEIILNIIEQGKSFSLKDNRFSDYLFKINGNLLKIKCGNSHINFKTLGNTFKLANSKGVAVDIVPVEKFGFEGIERAGSSRGYIWSRTLPMLKNTILIGFGPDTFAMNFPQLDYMGKLNHMRDAYILIDKPHNIYLQIAANTGVISLLAFLVILGAYTYSSIRLYYRRNIDNYLEYSGCGIFCAVIGYLISMFFTDSTVSVAPVFWALLGIGFSINYALSKLRY